MSQHDWLDPHATSGPERARLLDWLRLQQELGLAPGRAREALLQTGDPASALDAAASVGVRGAAPAPSAQERDLARLRQAGARGLPLLSSRYPESLARLSDAPPLLWVRGDPASLVAPALAIVGSRAATVGGLEVARRFARELAGAGLVIVSGLARGIDAAAHRGALEAGGRTVAVQACGPDRIYPAAHRQLAAAVAERGALITEFPPGAEPRKAHFPLRNRLISGLALGVLVVEARLRSGSLITARHALDQGSEVFAVPGALAAATSEGPNRLIRDGAWVALEPADVLEALGHTQATPAERKAKKPETSPGPLLAALSRGPATPDELARSVGLSPERFAVELLELELAGTVRRDRDGRLTALPDEASD